MESEQDDTDQANDDVADDDSQASSATTVSNDRTIGRRSPPDDRQGARSRRAISTAFTGAIDGISAVPVTVEVLARDKGERHFSIIGMPDNAVRESRDRVISALIRSGFEVPRQILVSLAPGEVRKEGAGFDLPIALAVLGTTGNVPLDRLRSATVSGELSLDGTIRPIRGAVSLGISAIESGKSRLMVPTPNAAEAATLKNIEITPVATLLEAVKILRGEVRPRAVERQVAPTELPELLLSQVRGQDSAKRALLIAAAGGHNIMMVGPPGCGKSMLAERLPFLLPPLAEDELRDVVKIHSIVGLPLDSVLGGTRPFRAPHHVVSDVGLVGGGNSPRPGEISLSHHGVLFLDEFPEYRRSALEALRTPLENGVVQISRARGSWRFPARFQLVAAMNPCPCGRLGSKTRRCICSDTAIQSYHRRLSQPILERIDIHVELEEVPIRQMTEPTVESTEDTMPALRDRVRSVRAQQMERQGTLNSLLDGSVLLSTSQSAPAALTMIEQASLRSVLSARSTVRVLRTARTIADLGNSPRIEPVHLAEALAYRVLDKRHAGTMEG